MTGVRRAVIHNPGAVIVFHSPMSCGQVIREKDTNGLRIFKTGVTAAVPVVTSNIENKDVIFGAHEKLQTCLEFVIEQHHPSYILIGNSCVSGIIGDDVDSVALSVSRAASTPIFTIPCSGFMNGGYEAGLKEAALRLVEAFVKQGDRKQNSVTLIGIVDKEKNFEFSFLEDVLSAWEIRINCIFPGYASVQEMQEIGQSKACILCSKYNMVHSPFETIAQAVCNKAKIPLMDVLDPLGYSLSLRWIEKAGAFLGVDSLNIQRMIEKQKKEYVKVINRYKKCFLQTKACIFFNKKSAVQTSLGWFWELLQLVGVEITAISFSENYTEEDCKIVVARESLEACKVISWKNLFSIDRDFAFIFCFGVNESKKLDNMLGIPYVNPIFGSKGMEAFYREMLKILRKGQHGMCV